MRTVSGSHGAELRLGSIYCLATLFRQAKQLDSRKRAGRVERRSSRCQRDANWLLGRGRPVWGHATALAQMRALLNASPSNPRDGNAPCEFRPDGQLRRHRHRQCRLRGGSVPSLHEVAVLPRVVPPPITGQQVQRGSYAACGGRTTLKQF